MCNIEILQVSGTGKTQLVRSLANECAENLFEVDCESFISDDLWESLRAFGVCLLVPLMNYIDLLLAIF